VGEGNTADQETIVNAGYLSILALSEASVMNISVGGGAGGKVAVNGSVSINNISNDVTAFIKNTVAAVDDSINLSAMDESEIQSIAGAVGGSQTAAVGAALAMNYIGSFGALGETQRISAYIENSRVVAENGSVTVAAHSLAVIKSISAAGGGGGKAAVYGAVSLNFINTDIAAYIKDCISPEGTADAQKKLVNANSGITLSALDKSSISVIAGNVAGAGTASVGAAVAIVYIGNGDLASFDKYVNNDEYTAEEASENRDITERDYDYDDPGFTETSKIRVYIDNSSVTSAAGAVRLKATAESNIINISAGVAIGGKAGVQGSVSVNYLYSNVWVQILNNSEVTAKGDILLEALSKGSSIDSLAGAVSGGGNAGAGIAIAVNYIANSYIAAIDNSQAVSESGDIVLTSENEAAIKTLSAAVAGGGNLALAGAVSLNFIHNNVSAAITGSSVSSDKTDAAIVGGLNPGIRITAKDISSIQSICGQVNASGTAGIGAAAGYNTVGNTIKAYISNSSTVTSKTFITVKALSEATIKTVVAGGGAGSVSINGSAAVNSIGNDVLAYIDASQVTSLKSIYLSASDSSEIGAIAGAVGASANVTIGASVAEIPISCMPIY